MDAPETWPTPRQRRRAVIAAVVIVVLIVAGLVWFFVAYPRGEATPEAVPVAAPRDAGDS